MPDARYRGPDFQFWSGLVLRRNEAAPSILEEIEKSGTYHEFWEVWCGIMGPTPSLFRSCQHATGRRFEMFEAVSSEFVDDVGLPELPGMMHVRDFVDGTVYRLRAS
jgi:hypothetical protein